MNNFGNNMILFPKSAQKETLEKTAEDEVRKKDKEKTKSKGDGINAALVLLKDLRDFQEKVEACIEAQDVTEYKQKVEVFNQDLDKMYEILLDIARGGMHANKAKESADGQAPTQEVSHTPEVSLSTPSSPIAPK